MQFKMIYNTRQIFTLEHSILLRNVPTRFSQLQVFVALLRLRNIFSAHLSTYITIPSFYSKNETFLYKLLEQIFKIHALVAQRYETH